jgi:phosphate:Na+ symporter
MVLGDNIGTTFTANVAAVMANRPAKRTALAHLLFNLLGATWAFPLIALLGSVLFNWLSSYFETIESTNLFGIAIFHTSFNIINTLIFLIFYQPFKKLCFSILPHGNRASERSSLKFINSSLLSTHELSILQARKKIVRMARVIHKIYSLIPELLHEKKANTFARLLFKTKTETLSIGDMKNQIAGYIDQIPDSQLSEDLRIGVKVMRETLDDLDAISKNCFEMIECIRQKKEDRAWFTQNLRNNLDREFRLVDLFFDHVINKLENNVLDTNKNPATDIKNELKTARLTAQKSFEQEDQNEKLPEKTEAYYKSLMRISEAISEHAFRIDKAIRTTKNLRTTNTYPTNI